MKILQLPNIGNGGRLGNMMFNIAALIGIALKNGYTPRIPKGWKYRDQFSIPEEWFGDIVPAPLVKESCYHYDNSIHAKLTADIVSMQGYFQSPKYWTGYDDEIRQYLTPKGSDPMSIDKVAIHYRRDDYVGNKNYAQLPVSYYLQQYSEYLNGKGITGFSDDVAFIKLHHAGAWAHDDDPIIELRHMIAHRFHIIANSTFSWWAAYLSDGFIIRPAEWFAGPLAQQCSIVDLFPDHWAFPRIAKCYLHDVTFIIPVSYDHPDRVENLHFIKDYLNAHFYTNIITGEINTNQMGADMHFDYGGKFHRTKALNEMTRAAKTRYVVNLDADVIVPPFQILEMVIKLRAGADVVYPYDGTFAGIERRFFPQVKADLNLSALRGEKWRGFGVHAFTSVGGVVGYNKESFLKAGGENENFVSYCPEDQERYWRFNLLGLKVTRVPGALYHLDHWRGANSGMRNPDSIAGHKYWEQIKHFTKDELIKHLSLEDINSGAQPLVNKPKRGKHVSPKPRQNPD